jgi:hypothetical protein
MARGSREVKVLITGDASKLASAISDVEGRFGRMGGVMKGALVGVSFAAIGRGLMGVANQFQDTAIAANDFATASGLSVEQASRWQEVAGDVGIEASKLQTTFGRLSKGLGQDRMKWQQYGVAVATAADGTVDANKTFLNAVDALTQIEDPLERAKVGSELFGRSWMDVAPLIELGAEDLATALNEVGDAQVIDEDEVDKAKRFRETMDTLNDTTTGLKLELAEGLIPVISTLATWLGELDPKMVTLGVTILGAVVIFGKLGTAIGGVSTMMSIFAAHPVVLGVALGLAGLALLIANWDKVTVAISRAIAMADAFARKVSGPIYAPVKAINNALGGNLGKGQNLATPQLQQYIDSKKGKATGGNTWGPTLVGERGPELIWPRGAGAYVSNASNTAAMLGGRGQTIINVHPAPGMDETALARAVVREQNRDQRAAGKPVAP